MQCLLLKLNLALAVASFLTSAVVSQQGWINITFLENAVEDGGVCLDGTPPAYHFDSGSGAGSKNWVVFLEGGGWCATLQSCFSRSRTALGSSAFMEKAIYFEGILSNSADVNPDFYNWNRVKVRYCDGASFAGNEDAAVTVPSSGGSQLMFRGMKIWRAVIKDLLSRGMHTAEKALLTGCSAGGLAAILHCNDFRLLLPNSTETKCVSDAGYFVDVQDVSGNFSFRSFYNNVVSLHKVEKQLPNDCTSQLGGQCFFPQNIVPYIQVPLLLVNPAYDVWQIQNILAPASADPHQAWQTCKTSPPNCSVVQLVALQDFRTSFLEASLYAQEREDWGLYINSCFTHCQTENREWNHAEVEGKTVQQAVGDWYFNRSQIKLVDCAFPCNTTCSG